MEGMEDMAFEEFLQMFEALLDMEAAREAEETHSPVYVPPLPFLYLLYFSEVATLEFSRIRFPLA